MVIAQVIKSLMILLRVLGLPALAVAHFGFSSGTSDACRHSAALSLLLTLQGAMETTSIFQPSPIPEVLSGHCFFFFNRWNLLIQNGQNWGKLKKSVTASAYIITGHDDSFHYKQVVMVGWLLLLLLSFSERMHLLICHWKKKKNTFRGCRII